MKCYFCNSKLILVSKRTKKTKCLICKKVYSDKRVNLDLFVLKYFCLGFTANYTYYIISRNIVLLCYFCSICNFLLFQQLKMQLENLIYKRIILLSRKSIYNKYKEFREMIRKQINIETELLQNELEDNSRSNKKLKYLGVCVFDITWNRNYVGIEIYQKTKNFILFQRKINSDNFNIIKNLKTNKTEFYLFLYDQIGEEIQDFCKYLHKKLSEYRPANKDEIETYRKELTFRWNNRKRKISKVMYKLYCDNFYK